MEMIYTLISNGSYIRTKHLCVWFTSEPRVRLVSITMFKPSSIFADRSVLLLWIRFVIYVVYLSLLLAVCYLIFSLQPCDHLLGKVWPLSSLDIIFSSVLSYGVTGQVWYLIVSIPDLCLHLYFVACEQQRHRPTCSSAQSDQRFWYSHQAK